MATIVPTLVDGDDFTDDFTLAVKAAVDELQAKNPDGVTSWTPAFTNLAIGTGGSAGLTANYRRNAAGIEIDVTAVLGTSGASVGGTVSFTLPPGFTPDRVNGNILAALHVTMVAGGVFSAGAAAVTATNTVTVYALTAGSTYVARTVLSSTVPGTWNAGSLLSILGTIRGTF